MIDPWGSELVEDYSKLLKELGLQEFDSALLKKFPKPNSLMRRGIVFGHMELEQLLQAKKSL